MSGGDPAGLLYQGSSLALIALGVVHSLQTAVDVVKPRFFVPESDVLHAELQRARLRFSRRLWLWPAWLGFNFTHGLGLCAIGALLLSLEPSLVRESAFLRGFPALVGGLYALVAARCFFWLPAAAYALITIGFGLSALL